MTPLDLTRRLLAFNTINPPGDEDTCVRYAGSLLERAGFATRYFAFAPRRTSLIAALSGTGSPRSLCFTGRLDTVPLGAAPWVGEILEMVRSVAGVHPVPQGAPYFTDASALTPALRHPPTVILGPGEPDQAHRTDEYCHVSKLEQATELYTSIARQWCVHP